MFATCAALLAGPAAAQAGTLSVEPESLNTPGELAPWHIGDSFPGTVGLSRDFVVTNSGDPSDPIWSMQGAHPNDFSVTDSDCGATLADTASCTLTVTFAPTAPGTRTATLRVADAISTSESLTDLTGLENRPVLDLDPSNATFGAVASGSQSGMEILTLRNTGNWDANISAVVLGGPNAEQFEIASNGCGASLGAGASCQIGVRFEPTTTGAKTANLDVLWNDGVNNLPPVSTALSGTAFTPTTATFTSPSGGSTFDFGARTLNTADTRVMTLANPVGGETFRILSIDVNGSGGSQGTGDFQRSGGGCVVTMTLVAGQSCTVNIIFQPNSTGTKSARVDVVVQHSSLSGNDGAVTKTIELTGLGAEPSHSLTPLGTHNFGQQLVGTTSAARAYTVQNTGVVPLDFSLNTGSLGPFTITSTTCGTTGGTLAVGGSCQISVAFHPESAGAHTGSLEVRRTYDNFDSVANFEGTGYSAFPVLAVDDPTFDFGSIQTGSSSEIKAFIVTNYGEVATQPFVNAISPSGQGFTKVSDTCHNANLGPLGSGNNTCQIEVRFEPTSAGAKSAQILIASSSASSPNTIELAGTGTAPPTGGGSTTSPPPATPAAPKRCKKGQKLKGGRCVKKKRKKR